MSGYQYGGWPMSNASAALMSYGAQTYAATYAAPTYAAQYAAPTYAAPAQYPVERQVTQEQVTVPQQVTSYQTQTYIVNVPQVTCSTITHSRPGQKL